MEVCVPLVTTIEMELEPAVREIEPEGCPDTTELPATVTVAAPLCRVGVTVIEFVLTLAV